MDRRRACLHGLVFIPTSKGPVINHHWDGGLYHMHLCTTVGCVKTTHGHT